MTPLGDPNDERTRWGIVPNYIGPSGCGKSERIGTVCGLLGLPFFPIYSATKTPEHFGGFPANTPEGFRLKCAMPQIIDLCKVGEGVLFLDEISTAGAAVQAALLSGVNERTFGDFELPPKTRIVMAMNPPDMAANGQDLEIPMANRIAHYEYRAPTVNQYIDYMNGNGGDKFDDFLGADLKVISRWEPNILLVKELVLGFLKAGGGTYKSKDDDGKEVSRSKLHDQPASDDPRASGPWPSHRTWKFAMHGMATSRCLEFDRNVEMDLCSALVGPGVTAEYTTYVSKMDLPQPEDVLAGKWKVPKRLDITRVVALSVVAHVAHMQDTEERTDGAVACWEFLGRVCEGGHADLVTPAVRELSREGLTATFNDNNPKLEAACMKVMGRPDISRIAGLM